MVKAEPLVPTWVDYGVSIIVGCKNLVIELIHIKILLTRQILGCLSFTSFDEFEVLGDDGGIRWKFPRPVPSDGRIADN